MQKIIKETRSLFELKECSSLTLSFFSFSLSLSPPPPTPPFHFPTGGAGLCYHEYYDQVWAADFDIRGIQDQMKEVELGIPKTLKWFLENLTTPVLLLDSCSSDKASLLLPMTMGPLKFDLRVPPSGYLERCSFNTSDCTFTILSFLDHVFESPWRLTHSMHLHSTANVGKKAKDEVQDYPSQQRERDSAAAAAAAAAADDDDDDDHNDGDGDDGGGTRNEGRKRKTYVDKNHITVKTSSTSKPELMPMSGKAFANKAKSSVGGAKIVSKKKRRR